MRRLANKFCEHCGKEYTPTGSCSRFCSLTCRNIVYAPRQKEHYDNYNRRLGRKVGVGKGGATGFGKDNQNYRQGLGIFAKNRHLIKENLRYCQHCGKDLIDATRYQWCAHHKDHNRNNNDPSNWTLLCKKCHQIEHKCWLALEGSTTSLIRLPNGQYSNPNKRSPQESGEMPDTLPCNAGGDDIV